MDLDGDGQPHERQAVPVPTRAPSTTIDELEKEFQRKKKRELEQARTAGASTSSNGTAPRTTGEKVGRNDPCPCGSGKKYKKCHGAQA
jgi:preprotein translocase subunit SecA